MALSPDGTRLAVTQMWTRAGRQGGRPARLQPGHRPGTELAAGHPGGRGHGRILIDIIETPSWAADGRRLALTVSSGKCQFCVRLLDTGGAGTTVQAASRVIVRSPDIHSPNVDWATTLLAPDGSRVLRSVTICVRTSKNECYDVAHVYIYFSALGRQLVALSNRAHNVDVDLMWSNPGGTLYVFSEVAEGQGPPFIRAFRYAPGQILHEMRLPAQTVSAYW